MSSILETFYILFKTNSDDVEKGIKKNSSALSTFERDALQAEAVVGAAGEYIGHVFEYVAVRIASAFAIEKVVQFTGAITEANAQLLITAERIGVDISDLDVWSRAARAAGGTSEGFTQSLDSLNRGLGRIAATGNSRLKPFFDELKIHLLDAPHHARPLFDVLGDLADRFSKMDKQSSSAIGESLMLDPGTVLLLQKGKEGVAELVAQQRALGVVTEEDGRKAHEYEQQLHDLETRLHFVATEITSSLIPALTNFFRGVGEIIAYLAQHKGLVEGFFIGIAGAITYFYTPAILTAIADTAALIAEWLLIAAPIILIGAAIALLVDDVQNFLAGNKSVIGELSKSWPEVGETVRAVVKDIGAAWAWLSDLLSGGAHLIISTVQRVAQIFQSVGGVVGNFIKEVWREWNEYAPGVIHFIELIASAISKVVGAIARFVGATVLALPKALKNYGDSIDDDIAQDGGKPVWHGERSKKAPGLPQFQEPDEPNTKAPAFQIADAPRRAVGSGIAATLAASVVAANVHLATADAAPLNSISNHTSQITQARTVTIGPITVEVNAPGANAQEISQHVATHLSTALRQAVDQHDDGVQN